MLSKSVLFEQTQLVESDETWSWNHHLEETNFSSNDYKHLIDLCEFFEYFPESYVQKPTLVLLIPIGPLLNGIDIIVDIDLVDNCIL